MRYLVLIGMLLASTIVYAEITTDEETYLKCNYALEKIKSERNDKIIERDNLLVAEDIKCQSSKQVILDTYQPIIDAFDVSLSNTIGELDALVSK